LHYDFDTVIDRKPWNSYKWSYLRDMCPNHGDDVTPMWIADMDFAIAPEIQAAIVERASHAIHGYPGKPDSFFRAFSDWMRDRHEAEVSKEQVRITPGIVPAIGIAIDTFTRPGDGIVIQPPVYHPFAAQITDSGRRVVQNPLAARGDGSYEIDWRGLERVIDDRTRMIILCSPHNPVARVWKRDDLERLAEIAVKRDLIVVVDEIHADLVYAPHRHHCALTVEPLRDRLVLCSAPSKTFNIAGLSTSCIVIPDPRMRSDYTASLDRLGLGTTTTFGFAAAEAAWREGGPWLEALLTYLSGNAALIVERLSGTRLAVSPMEGTFLAWIDFRNCGVEGNAHCSVVGTTGLWLDEGGRFGIEGLGFARLNYGLPRSELSKALDKLVASFG
jgi:cystathionine beta-lyase